jgi:ribosome maturation factor RimP
MGAIIAQVRMLVLGSGPVAHSFLLDKGGSMSKITDRVWALAQPVVEGFGLKLWDVEYVREGADWFLRVYIDKDGAVDINDCEQVSRAMDPILDEADPIPDSYTFEVCSAGCERVLKRPSDFQQFLGAMVLVKLYRPRDGQKEYVGTLKSYEAGTLGLETGKETLTFTTEEIAQVRLYVEF